MTNEKLEKHREDAWLRLADLLKESHDIIKNFFPQKKEIVIDKLGKWKSRDGSIRNVISINGKEPEYPVETDNGSHWTANGYFYSSKKISDIDLIQFISPPEFTEEGLYEMANGEKIDVEKNLYFVDELRHPFFQEKTNNVDKKCWNKDGKCFGFKFIEHPNYLIRYLGKKPFEIDRVGIYEADNGEKYVCTSLKPLNTGDFFLVHINMGVIHFYKKDGTGTYGNVPRIVKFLSTNWNFQKGESI